MYPIPRRRLCKFNNIPLKPTDKFRVKRIFAYDIFTQYGSLSEFVYIKGSNTQNKHNEKKDYNERKKPKKKKNLNDGEAGVSM